MKRLYTILFLVFCTASMYAQNNVFVLVDVSRSVTQTDLNNAKEALSQVLTGVPLTKAFVSQGSQSDLVNFKLGVGDKFSISKFGSLNTTLAINPNQTQIQNVNADVYQVLNSFGWIPTDGQTYLTLAKAKIAEYAKNNKIGNYKLLIISDNVNDDYGKNGRPNYPDDYIRDLAECYHTPKCPVDEADFTKIKFSRTSGFALAFSPKVDVTNYQLPVGVSSPILTSSDSNAVITILPKAKKGKEYKVTSETVNINWNCQNCPQGIKYTVTVSQYEDGKYRDVKKDLIANSATFKLPDGKFRVSVSASNYANASSDTTYLSVSTGGYGWIIFLLIILAAAGIGYYYWNKKRQKKIDVFATNKSDDIFSKSSGGATTNNSSNSDYF